MSENKDETNAAGAAASAAGNDWAEGKQQEAKDSALLELEAGLAAAAHGPPHEGGDDCGGSDDDGFYTPNNTSSLNTEDVVAFSFACDEDEDGAAGPTGLGAQRAGSCDLTNFQGARESFRSRLTMGAYFAGTAKDMLSEHRRAQKEADQYMSEVYLSYYKAIEFSLADFKVLVLQCVEWMGRAGRALLKAKDEGAGLWPLYKSRCADLRAVRKLLRKRNSELDALKAEKEALTAENEALRRRADAADKDAEIAVRRRTELQEKYDAYIAQMEWGNPENFGSSSSSSEGSQPVAIGRGRRLFPRSGMR